MSASKWMVWAMGMRSFWLLNRWSLTWLFLHLTDRADATPRLSADDIEEL